MGVEAAGGAADAERRVADLLGGVRAALGAADLAAAERLADTALRCAPGNPDLLQVFGDVLLAAGQPARGLERLEHAAAVRPAPQTEASIALALLALRRNADALTRTDLALKRFATPMGGALARAAAKVVVDAGAGVVGWAGLTESLEVCGDVLVGLDALGDGGVLEAHRRGKRLIGPGPGFRPDFDLDGRAWREGPLVRGWARLGWAPRLGLRLFVTDEEGDEIEAPVTPGPDGKSSFILDVGSAALRGRRWTVWARLPDGGRAPLPASPVLARLPPPPPPAPAPLTAARQTPPQGAARPIAVVIPVYDGLGETLACIASVRRTVGKTASLVVVNDASPNAALVAELELLAAAGAIELLHNPRNQGFPHSVNRGAAAHPDHDVVILNADAEVFPGWLESLRTAAYGFGGIGTVTPLTNSGSIASYPGEGSACDAAGALDVARVAANARLEPIEAPTGVGFCMYIRRQCLDETGGFDAACFGRGYGEENDFCLRASRLGWRHLILPGVYVRHVGGGSFGDQTGPWLERNLRLLNERHPGYDATIEDFLARDPLRLSRRRLDEILLRRRAERVVLIVTLDLPGGVDRFVTERAASLAADGAIVVLLRPGGESRVRLEVHEDPWFQDLVYDGQTEIADLAEFLRSLRVGGVEVHHFLDLDGAVVEAALGLAAPYDVYIHDYLWICPRITLIGAGSGYCGEPGLADCEACLQANGGRAEPGLTVAALRSRSRQWLAGARRVVAPARDVAARLRRYFPGLEIAVEPWESHLTGGRVPRPAAGGPIRIAVVGAIGDHKGYQVLLACAQDAARRRLPLEFVVIGYTQDDEALLSTGRCFVTGRYDEGEIDALIAREAPDAALFASVWPETWCYALSHALRAGLPVMAFDLGAVAERLRFDASPRHRLITPGTPAETLDDLLMEFGASSRTPRPANDRPPAGRSAEIFSRETPVLTNQQALEHPGPTMQTPASPLIVSGEVIPLNKGIYRFSVDQAAPRRVGEEGELVLPAVHVGLGPGVAPDSLEVMTGLRTDGAWLFDPRDVLIVKAKVSPTLVLLTNVRAEGMAPLELSVEKIDIKKAAAVPTPTPVARVAAAAQPQQPLQGPTPAQMAEAMARASTQAGGARKDDRGRALLPVRITAHIRQKGDMTFVDKFWAGALGENLPIEALSIMPLEGVPPDQLEYKALTATGVETPWTSSGAFCGTRGMRIPLVGFAVRLRGEAEARFNCEYRGAFSSGKIVGPLSDGAPCRAVAADDYLEGVQLTLLERTQPNAAADPPSGAADTIPEVRPEPPVIGARFSVFRENVA